MAVAFDAVGPSSGGTTGSSPLSWTHTPVGTPTHVIVGVSAKSASIGTAITATYGGVSMTELGRRASNDTAGAGVAVLFGIASPGSGAKTVSVTSAVGNLIGGSVSFTGSAQLGTAVTGKGDNGTGSAPPSIVVTGTTSGNQVIDVVVYGSPLNNPNQTQRWNDNVDTATGAGNAAQSTAAAGGSITMSYSPTAHDWWGMVAVEVQASSGPTTVNGTGTAPLGAISATGAGVATVLGSGTAPLGTFSASGSGVAIVLGAGTAPLGALVATGGTFTITGSGSANLGFTTATGAGVATVVGSGTAPLGSINATGAGSGVPTVTGSGSAQFALGATGFGVAEVLGGGSAPLGTANAALDQVLVFYPNQRRQISMIKGSLRFSYQVSFTTWKDAGGVWRSQETPPAAALSSATRLLAVSGRPQIVDDATANELRAANPVVGTIVPVARKDASQWL